MDTAPIEALDDEAVNLDVDADTASAQSEIGSLDADPVEVPVDADTSEAEAAIDSLDGQSFDLLASIDFDALEEAVASIPDVEIEVTADTTQATDAIDGLGQSADGAAGNTASLTSALGGLDASGVAAAAGIGSASVGVVALGAGLVTAIQSAGEASGILAVTTQTIENMGSSSGVTIEGVQALATQLQQTAGVSDEATLAAAGLIARFGTLNNRVGEGNDIFDRTLLVGADVARVLGTDITSAAELLGKAVANPEVGVSRLARRFPQLTEEVQNNIVALQQSGDLLGAQRLLLDTLSGSVEGTAAAYGESLAGQIDITTESLGELAEAIGGALAPSVVDLTSDLTSLFDSGSAAVAWADETIQSLTGIGDAAGTLGDVLQAAFTNLNPIGLASNFRDFATSVDLTGASLEDAGLAYERVGIDVDALRRQKEGLTEEEEASAEALRVATEAVVEQAAAFEELESSVNSSLPTLADAISNVEGNLNDFGQTIDSSTDAQLVVDNLAQMLQAFAEFGDNLTIIAEQGGNFGPTLARYLSDLGPEVAGGIAAAFAEAPEEFAGQLEFLQAIAEEEGISLIEVLSGTFADATTAGADAIESRRGDVDRAASTVGRSGAQSFDRSIRAIEGNATSAARSATAAVRAERDAADRAGDFLGSGFSTGTRRGARDMRPNAREGANSAIDGVKELTQVAFRGGERVGDSLADGIAEGLEDGTPAITAAAVAAVNAAIAAARNAAQANSPSMLFADLGRDMVEGMALGLSDGAAVVAAAEALTADAAGSGGAFAPVVNVTVNASGSTDPEAIGEAVSQAAQQALWRAEVQAMRRR